MILITGGSGKLATDFKKTYNCLSPPKQELDVSDFMQVLDYLSNHKEIKIIIHAAAMTSVEACENNKNLAYVTNIIGTRNIIRAMTRAKKNNTLLDKLVYISTPCVFDGVSGNYDEDSKPFPKNYYGYTKAVSEELVKSSGLKYLIVRTNFKADEKWPYPKAFTDRYGTYLFSHQVADLLAYHVGNSEGMVHIVGKKKMSMFELAKLTTPNIKPMTTKDYRGNAELTKDMSMTSKRWHSYEIKHE